MLKWAGLCRERRAIDAASDWVDILYSIGVCEKQDSVDFTKLCEHEGDD